MHACQPATMAQVPPRSHVGIGTFHYGDPYFYVLISDSLYIKEIFYNIEVVTFVVLYPRFLLFFSIHLCTISAGISQDLCQNSKWIPMIAFLHEKEYPQRTLYRLMHAIVFYFYYCPDLESAKAPTYIYATVYKL